ncbi:MAG: S8 family peptidase [Agathobacter sp.]|nr:S8 family peptidase [Agathobacter sp.]
MPCSEVIQSNDVYDFIVASDERNTPLIEPVCVQSINRNYDILYYDRSTVPPLSISRYSYTSIPKLFSLMDSTSLDVSGILAIQNQPALSLRGEGTLVGIIDTGIDYTNPLFQDGAGNTRIVSIWDQTVVPQSESMASEVSNQMVATKWLHASQVMQIQYGVEYTREQLNEALNSEMPQSIVPEVDTNGHGTYLASIAAGSADPVNDFIGAAPGSELVIVKLKEAKQNLRDFFYYSSSEPLFQENDIMAGVAYLDAVARREQKPLVILLGVGSNQGSHTGAGPLSILLDDIGAQIGRVVVVPAGNQAAAQHHFYGEAVSLLNPVAVEINVEEGFEGFCMELWAYAPELVRVVVQSPTGQQSQGGFPVSEETQTTNFVFENTVLTLDYRIAGKESGDLVIFFRFSRPAAGIWTVYVYPEHAITGAFHIWLPIQPLVGNDIRFIEPNPDTTVTTPGMTELAITAGGYNGLNGARFLQSGRGFSGTGQVKPEFCAPAVNVSGADLRGNYIEQTGTSAAAAITAGAASLVLEWGLLRGNAPMMNSVEVKNLLIRGCERELNRTYPNTEWGYGKLNVYRAFQVLRE